MEAECWTLFECRRHCTTSNSRTAWKRSSDSLVSSCSVRVSLAWDWLRIYLTTAIHNHPQAIYHSSDAMCYKIHNYIYNYIIIYIYIGQSLDVTRLKSALLPTWSTSGRGKSLRIQVSPGVKVWRRCTAQWLRPGIGFLGPQDPIFCRSSPKEKNPCSGIFNMWHRDATRWFSREYWFFCRLVGSLAWKVTSIRSNNSGE